MTLRNLLAKIRSDMQLEIEVPGIDPSNGNENARFLFVMEAPGPKAVLTGMISLDNPDPSARNFRSQLDEAGVRRTDIALWNVVPWYLGSADRMKIRGARVSDVKQGLDYLGAAIACISRLECVVLVGGAARQAHIYLSRNIKTRILSCHHPSQRVLNTNPGAAAENIAVFRSMLG